MKIAIVGGSAASTPGLFLTPEVLALAGRIDVTLIGRAETRLRGVARAVEILSDGAISPECTTEMAGLDDAELVILQARYGGYSGRARDEAFPLRHDLCGDEGLGPGGLAAAWRSWPHLSNTLENITQRCPRAKVLLMTAPLSLLVRCATAGFRELDVVGICELPWVTLKSVCDALNVNVDTVQFSYAGINHLGWFDQLRAGSTDLIPRYASTRRDVAFPSADLIHSQGAIPLKYLRLHYEPAEVLQGQRAQRPRAVELQFIADRAADCFASGGRAEIIEALGARPTPWYEHAVAPMVAAASGRATSTVFFLSAPNDGYLPFLAPSDTIEQPFVMENGVRYRLPRRREFPHSLSRTLERFVEYERSAAQAVLGNQRDACAGVLAKHPWVRACGDVDSLAADLIAAI